MTPVLLDASVLFPNVLRDTLLTLAEHDLYEPLWSAQILAEVRRNVIENAQCLLRRSTGRWR